MSSFYSISSVSPSYASALPSVPLGENPGTQNAAQQWLAQNPGATAQDIIDWAYASGGDTYAGAGQLLQQLGIDINQLIANRQAPASSIIGGGSADDASGSGTATAASSNYTVQSGDTLSAIADDVRNGLQDVVNYGKDKANDIWGGLKNGDGIIKDWFNQAKNNLSPEKLWLDQIKKLNSEDDSCKLTAGGNASFETLTADGEGSIEVERNADGKGYTVRAGGKLGVGVDASLAKASGAADVGAEAMARGGAYVEYTFDTPEEAAKAAGILTMSASPALEAAIALGGKPNEDAKFLTDHISAIELGGEIAGKLEAEAGLVAGLEGNATVNGYARIEFEKNTKGENKPAYLVLGGKGEVKLDAHAGLGVKGEDSKGKEGEFSMEALGADGTATVTMEQRFKLDPSKFSVSNLLSDPLNTLKGFTNFPKSEVSLDLKLEGKLNTSLLNIPGVPNDGGICLDLSLSGEFDKVCSKNVVSSLVKGDFSGAFQELGPEVNVNMTTSKVSNVELDQDLSLKVGGTGGGVDVKAQRTDYEQISSKTGTLDEVVKVIFG